VLRDGKIEADDKLLIDRIVAEKSALEPWELASDCCPTVGAWRVVVDNLRDKGIPDATSVLKKWRVEV
jgi:hypothetical protein